MICIAKPPKRSWNPRRSADGEFSCLMASYGAGLVTGAFITWQLMRFLRCILY